MAQAPYFLLLLMFRLKLVNNSINMVAPDFRAVARNGECPIDHIVTYIRRTRLNLSLGDCVVFSRS